MKKLFKKNNISYSDSKPVRTIPSSSNQQINIPNENDDVLDWLRIMSNDRFRRLPVVDKDGKIKVIFTQGDFVSYTWPDLFFQASQMAKASFMKGFSFVGVIIMVFVYTIAMIVAIRAFT